MKLIEYLKNRFGVSDESLLLAYIRTGYVRIEGNVVTNPDFEVKGGDVELENDVYLRKGADYWCMREVMEMAEIDSMDRVLGFELKQGHVDAILDRRAEVVVLNFQDYGLENYVQCFTGNIFYEDFTSKLKGRFDVMVSFIKSNPIRVFGVIEKYMELMMDNPRIAIVVDDSGFDSPKELRSAYENAANLLLLELKKFRQLTIGGELAILFTKKRVNL